jgi:hypothetical protein
MLRGREQEYIAAVARLDPSEVLGCTEEEAIGRRTRRERLRGMRRGMHSY